MRSIVTLTAQDGTPLHALWSTPDGPVRACVVHIHGLGEHSGRHTHVGDALNRAGYACLSLDLRGHGRSGGTRGHTPFARALEDLDVALDEARARTPDAALFLYGNSMGGLLCLTYVLRRRPDLAGVVVTAPALRSPVLDQTVKITAAKVLGRAAPWVVFPSGLDDSGLSRDPAVIEAYRADPYTHDKASLALGKDGAESAAWVLAHAHEFTLPLLMLHGSADPIVYPSGSEEFAGRVPGDVTLRLYEGLRHEPHNEPEQQEVFADIVAWLDAHVPGGSPGTVPSPTEG